jgi:lysine 2,3-aminomutase
METDRLRTTEEDEPPGRPSTPSSQTFTASLITEDVRQNSHAPQKRHPFRFDSPALVPRSYRPKSHRFNHRFPISSRCRAFLQQFYAQVCAGEWNDWHWQLRNRIRTIEQLSRFLELTVDEITAILRRRGTLPLSITPYYASLLDPADSHHPLRRTVVPVNDEYIRSQGEAEDPLGEDRDSPVDGIVHRYPDRVLFLVTESCSTNCRYCTRSRMVGGNTVRSGLKRRWEGAIRYVEENPQIRDVLISGGDPLTLSDEKLQWLLSRLRAVRHVELLRIGTKVPVVLPQRITPALTRMLKRFHPLWMSIHFTHPQELTQEAEAACGRLADAGIPLGSQTVLLAGINDSVETMRQLMHGLVRMRVKPYYLYQCDPILGSAHFRTPVRKGLDIIEGLRGFTTGYAVPTYVIDAPGGGGKIPLLPHYEIGRDEDDLLLRNYEGKIFRYPDPAVIRTTAGAHTQAIGIQEACLPEQRI